MCIKNQVLANCIQQMQDKDDKKKSRPCNTKSIYIQRQEGGTEQDMGWVRGRVQMPLYNTWLCNCKMEEINVRRGY